MLRIEMNQGRGSVAADGDLIGVVADLATSVHRIYNMLHKNEPACAEAFKLAVRAVIVDPASGVFNLADIGGNGIVTVIPVKDQK